MHKPVDGALSPWRISDQLANVKSFWQTQTFQAHHIVEFNNLESLGLSTRNGTEDLDYKGLPCVLLSAELHQRYVSSVLKHTHKPGQDPETCLNGLEKEYKDLYGGSALQPLWEISQIVLAAAKHELQRKKGKR